VTNSDTPPLISRADIPAALGLLTRLPLRVDFDRARARSAQATWAYPLVGLVVGSGMALLGLVLTTLGLPDQITAALVLALSIIVTGAMHEDGLADSADGLWGGWDPDHRLTIMKDSYIGAYGVIAIGLSLILRWSLLTVLVGTPAGLLAMIAAAMLSRASMTALMVWLPNARTTGLSQSVGRPAFASGGIAVGISILAGVIFMGVSVAPAVIAVAVTAFVCGAIARAKINGQTGDILGATQQLTEIAALTVILTA